MKPSDSINHLLLHTSTVKASFHYAIQIADLVADLVCDQVADLLARTSSLLAS